MIDSHRFRLTEVFGQLNDRDDGDKQGPAEDSDNCK
jgi:hypothetical protein